MKFIRGKYKRDEKWKKRQSKISIEFWSTVDKKLQGEKMSKGWSDEAKLKQGARIKKLWTNKKYRDKLCAKKQGKNNPNYGKHNKRKITQND